MIKQEFAAMEMCACEAKNRYRISEPQGEEEGGEIFLYIDEESECCERICCSRARALTLRVHQGSNKDGTIVQSMHKPFSCGGICCCLRPHFDVYGPGGEGDKIGYIDDPCRCCLMDQQVYDKSDKLLFQTKGSICQLGICCPCCASVDFSVLKDEKEVATISKRPMTCCECLQKTNRFTIDFNQITEPEEKRMLLAAAMLADLEYFEEQKNDNSN